MRIRTFIQWHCVLRGIFGTVRDTNFFLYDLGLQDPEREKLRELDVTIEQIPQRNDIFDFNSKHNIRTTHKMGCIDHFLRKYKKKCISPRC